MEFRCPACDTSYRVPVRIDQQVRCARCNHVWRISETDFVIVDDNPDETEMPDEFSGHETDGERGAAEANQPDEDSLAALLDDRVSWPARPDEWQDTGEHANAGPFGDTEPRGPSPERYMPDVTPEQESGLQAFWDTARKTGPGQGRAALDEEPAAESGSEPADGQFADDWFSGEAGRVDKPDTQPGGDTHAGGFERIMEGIEEVIAETGSTHDDSAASDDGGAVQGDDLLRTLVSEGRATGFGDSGAAVPQASEAGTGAPEDAWSGNVVRLTVPGAGQHPENRIRNVNDGPGEEAARTGGAVEPMAAFIGKIAGENVDAAGVPQDDRPETSGDDYAGQQPEDQRIAQEPQMDQVNLFTRRAGMDDSPHPGHHGADPYAREHGGDSWTSQADDSDGHSFGRREDDVFAAGDDGFGDHDTDTGALGDAPEDVFAARAAADRDPGRDDPAFPELASNTDDDTLLAEYDFGADDAADLPGAHMADSRVRRGAGALSVTAAWGVFLMVLAAGALSVVQFREGVAEILPASAPLYAAAGFPVDQPALAFEEVSYAWSGTPPTVLVLNGQVKNTRPQAAEIPPLRITVRDENGDALLDESRFLGQASLAPGETYDFSVDVRAPANKLKTVELGF